MTRLIKSRARQSKIDLTCLFTALMMLGASSALADDVAIVKADNPVATISKGKLKKILLGKMKKWGNGDQVVLVTLKTGDLHERFMKKFAGKTAKQFTNYWRKMVFSGKGKMPPTFTSETELMAFVKAHKGAIGYVASETAQDGTKVLVVD
ncbi:MAG: hypothetical protein VYA34_01540 [Myxococcota bacterium]|nr:hypothetical protein [Myxococcota bacterium]